MERVDIPMQINIANHDCTIIWDGVYYFALSDYPNISQWELKKLLAFIEYEKQHNRETEIICEDNQISAAISHAITHLEAFINASRPDKLTECTACKQGGCMTKFLCHTSSAENAVRILTGGSLLSATKVFGKSGDDLVSDVRNAAGDPADYFEYIMFTWGNCFAGDNLVVERNLAKKLGRAPTWEEQNEALENNFTPGARFYFRYEDIISHPKYTFDGYHPAKIKDELKLADYLYACVIPEQYRSMFESLIKSDIAGKVFYLPQDNLGKLDWAERVYDFVCLI